MAVTEGDVRRMASLARLGLDPHNVPRLVGELNGILAHMEALQQVELGGIDSDDAGVRNLQPAGMPLRPDDVPSVVLAHPRESFAPSARDGFFLVPRLSTHGAVGASTQQRAVGEGDA